MPRPENPLDEANGLVAEFAGDLRRLRDQAGRPSYRALAKRAHYSAAALADAAAGRRLPTLAVTVAYVRACGGPRVEWEQRWRLVAAELARDQPVSDSGGDAAAPYVGLAAFQREDADRFFGRDVLVADLVARLGERRFLGVFGASGCGKSSLLRAGLAAALSAGQDRASTVVVFTPGHHPLEECAIHLAPLISESPTSLRDELCADPRALHVRVRQLAANNGGSADVVLVVDQFEELFTLCGDEQERAGFLTALVTAVTDPASRTRVVLGARADFLGHCGRYPELLSVLRDAQVLVGAMSTEELRLAVTRPAEQAGYRVENALVTRVVTDATRQPGMLPLVSHALLQTWRRRQGTLLTVAGYDAVGGIEHALARTAEDVFQALDPDRQQLAQQIFLRLTALGEGTEDTKRRLTHDELDHHDDPNTAIVLETLAHARLLTIGSDGIDLAHEALIRHWPRLHDWLTTDRDGHRLHRQLTDATADWERHHQDSGLLYRGARLTAWQDRSLHRLNQAELRFLTTSRRAARRDYRARRRRIRWTLTGLGTATAVITVLAVIAFLMASRAEEERTLAVGKQLATDARAQLHTDPELALLLAREAYRRTPNKDTEAILRQASADSHLRATLHVSTHPTPGPYPVTDVAFRPDGQHLTITGAATQTVWDWEAGRIIRSSGLNTINNDVPPAEDLAVESIFSENCRHITQRRDETANELDAQARSRPDHRTTFPKRTSKGVAFSPDGQRVAIDDGPNIHVWADKRNGPQALSERLSWKYSRHDGGTAMAFDPAGRHFACVTSDGTIRIWDLISGSHVILQLDNPNSQPAAMAFSPDGTQLITAHLDGAIRAWSSTGAAAPVLLGRHAGTATSATYSPDGHSIASTGIDGTVRIWNASQSAAPLILRGHQGKVNAAAFSADGNLVASASSDGTAKIWAVDEVHDVTVLRGHQGPVHGIAATSDGQHIASGGQDGTIRIWNTTDNHTPPTVLAGNGHPVLHVTFSPNGSHIATVHENQQQHFGDIRVWNTKDLTASAAEFGDHCAFSPGGEKLAISPFAGIVNVVETNGTGNSATFTGGTVDHALPFHVAWSPDGHHIAAANIGVQLWDPRKPYKPRLLPGRPGPLRALTFSPDSKHLASAGEVGAIHLWNVTNTANPTVLTGHQGPVTHVAFSADSQHLISSGQDGTVRIWPTDNTSQPLVLDGFRAAVQAIAPLPDDRYATAHDDGTIRIWRCPTCGPITDILNLAEQHITRQLTTHERNTYLSDNP